MEDFEARSQPYLPEGQHPPGEQRSKREWSGNSPLSALGRESVVDISEGTLPKEARSVLPGLPSGGGEGDDNIEPCRTCDPPIHPPAGREGVMGMHT